MSTTRVRNQRRTTNPVTGFCDRQRTGHLLGCARVSTADQQPHQVGALKCADCFRVFTETASGAASNRPVLAQVLDQLGPGDTLVVWKPYRFPGPTAPGLGTPSDLERLDSVDTVTGMQLE